MQPSPSSLEAFGSSSYSSEKCVIAKLRPEVKFRLVIPQGLLVFRRNHKAYNEELTHYGRNLMKIKDVIKKKKEAIENNSAFPYIMGGVIGLGLVVISYGAAYKGARDGLDDLKFEFNFVSKDGQTNTIGLLEP